MVNESSNRYFVWLCSLIVNSEFEARLHDSETMLRGLFDEPFIDWIPNDDNRAAEGHGLRDKYIDETGNELSKELYFSNCSLLEMLVALAQRFAWEIVGIDESLEELVPSCFWVMIDNLELNPHSENHKKLAVLNKREYSYTGRGGLFPLVNTKEDQRNVEIWYQMQEYIQEKYRR